VKKRILTIAGAASCEVIAVAMVIVATLLFRLPNELTMAIHSGSDAQLAQQIARGQIVLFLIYGCAYPVAAFAAGLVCGRREEQWPLATAFACMLPLSAFAIVTSGTRMWAIGAAGGYLGVALFAALLGGRLRR